MISSAKAGISAKFSMQKIQAIFVINSNLNELMNDGGGIYFQNQNHFFQNTIFIMKRLFTVGFHGTRLFCYTHRESL